MKKIILIAALTLLTFAVNARTISKVSELSWVPVAEVASTEGESLEAFLTRIAPTLRAYSDATGFEACGVIASNGQTYSVTLGSSKSHLGCASYSNKVQEGYKATGETIHSHGTNKQFAINDADAFFLGGRPRVAYFAGQVLDQFSEVDYQTPGYLATPTGIIHQAGKGKG